MRGAEGILGRQGGCGCRVDNHRGGVRSRTTEHADAIGHHRVGAGLSVEVGRGSRDVGVVQVSEIPLDIQGSLGRRGHDEGHTAVGILDEGGVRRADEEGGEVGR